MAPTWPLLSAPAWRVLILTGVGVLLIVSGADWPKLRAWWDEVGELMTA